MIGRFVQVNPWQYHQALREFVKTLLSAHYSESSSLTCMILLASIVHGWLRAWLASCPFFRPRFSTMAPTYEHSRAQRFLKRCISLLLKQSVTERKVTRAATRRARTAGGAGS